MMLTKTITRRIDRSAAAAKDAPREGAIRERERRIEALMVKITGSTSIGTNRWSYTWQRADVNSSNDFALRTGGSTGSALNTCEGINNGTNIGPGYLVANIPAGFSVKAVTGYVVIFPIHRTDGTVRWVFSVPNAIDGVCE